MPISSFSIVRNALSALPPEAKPSDRAVLLALGTFANSEGRGLWPKARRISEMTGLARVTVFQCMARLKTFGALADDGMHVSGTMAVPCRRLLVPGEPIPTSDDDPDDVLQENQIGPVNHASAPRGDMASHMGGDMASHTPPVIPPTPPFLLLKDQREERDPPFIITSPPLTPSQKPDKGGKRPCRSPSGLAEIDSFQDFYSRYPRHVDRGHAEQMWNWALKQGATGREIIDGLERQLPSMQGREAKFIPHPGTWLRGKRWLDEAPPTWQEDLARVARELSTTDTEAWFKPYLNGEIT